MNDRAAPSTPIEKPPAPSSAGAIQVHLVEFVISQLAKRLSTARRARWWYHRDLIPCRRSGVRQTWLSQECPKVKPTFPFLKCRELV